MKNLKSVVAWVFTTIVAVSVTLGFLIAGAEKLVTVTDIPYRVNVSYPHQITAVVNDDLREALQDRGQWLQHKQEYYHDCMYRALAGVIYETGDFSQTKVSAVVADDCDKEAAEKASALY